MWIKTLFTFKTNSYPLWKQTLGHWCCAVWLLSVWVDECLDKHIVIGTDIFRIKLIFFLYLTLIGLPGAFLDATASQGMTQESLSVGQSSIFVCIARSLKM